MSGEGVNNGACVTIGLDRECGWIDWQVLAGRDRPRTANSVKRGHNLVSEIV